MTDTSDKQTESPAEDRPEGTGPDQPHGAADAAGTTSPTDEPQDAAGPDEGQSEVGRLQNERDKLDNQLKHAMADLANFRKRQAKERIEIRNSVIEGMANELFPVLDNFSYALAAEAQQQGEDNSSSIVEGLRMVQTMLTGVLERHGVTEIPAAGQPFDPNVHEAVGVEAREGVPEGTILMVNQTGYRIGDRVVRPSRVTVAGQPGEDTPADGEEG